MFTVTYNEAVIIDIKPLKAQKYPEETEECSKQNNYAWSVNVYTYFFYFLLSCQTL